MLLRAVPIRHHRRQAGTVGGRDLDGDPFAHPRQMGIDSRRESFLRRDPLEANADRLLGLPRTEAHAGADAAPAEEKLRRRLRKQCDHLFTFLDHEAVDATNNLAERQLRPAVISRKLSCGNKTEPAPEPGRSSPRWPPPAAKPAPPSPTSWPRGSPSAQYLSNGAKQVRRSVTPGQQLVDPGERPTGSRPPGGEDRRRQGRGGVDWSQRRQSGAQGLRVGEGAAGRLTADWAYLDTIGRRTA